MQQTQINLQEIAKEQVFTQTLAERDSLILALAQNNGELQQRIKELEGQLEKYKDNNIKGNPEK